MSVNIITKYLSNVEPSVRILNHYEVNETKRMGMMSKFQSYVVIDDSEDIIELVLKTLPRQIDLSFISSLSHIKKLHLEYSLPLPFSSIIIPASVEDIAIITPRTTMTISFIDHSAITSLNLEMPYDPEINLTLFRNLRNFKIDVSGTRRGYLPQIQEMNQLIELAIKGFKGNFDFDILPKSPSLTKFELISSNLQDVIKPKNSFNKVIEFGLRETITPTLKPFFEAFPLLRVITIVRSRFVDQDIRLNSLISVSILWCNLIQIPKFVINSSSIENLDICDNSIKSIGELCHLSKLKRLHCQNNKLKQIPECIFDLTELQYLYAGDNSISNLPYSRIKSGKTKLRKIFLINTKIKENKVPARLKGIVVLNKSQ